MVLTLLVTFKDAFKQIVIDCGLTAHLATQPGIIFFKEYLESEMCSENLEFWCEVQEFTKQTTPEEIENQAELIYHKFITSKSPRKINLMWNVSSAIRKAIEGIWCADMNINVTPLERQYSTVMYQQAANAVFRLMKQNNWTSYTLNQIFDMYIDNIFMESPNFGPYNVHSSLTQVGFESKRKKKVPVDKGVCCVEARVIWLGKTKEYEAIAYKGIQGPS